jgi:alpha-tubulin suppressor-like RCC1 family protein
MQVNRLSDVVWISSGANHTCAIKSDGTAWCWGNNEYGQLGNGDTKKRTVPVQVIGLDGAEQITCGDKFSCAMKTDGTAWCWGNNKHGQLGSGTSKTKHTRPVQVVWP